MKKRLTQILTFLILILFIVPGNIVAQNDIEVIVHETTLTDTIGSEMIFDFEVINISNAEQTVFVVRTIDDLPPNWTSSLCFGENCFAPFVDSVATDSTLSPEDTLIASLHVTAWMNAGTANVQIQVGTLHDPDNRRVIDYTAIVIPSSVENEGEQPNEYFLAQNYPNPFNPSTNIKFGLNEAGFVSLKIYDVLGNEVADLVNEYKSAGNYKVSFESNSLSSGIYIYRLVTNNFSNTRKMILEK